MTKREFDQLQEGDVVRTSFSNSMRKCVIVEKQQKHVIVECKAVKGGMLRRRARYQSLSVVPFGSFADIPGGEHFWFRGDVRMFKKTGPHTCEHDDGETLTTEHIVHPDRHKCYPA